MSDLAAGYIQNLAQDEGEQLKDALDKDHQLELAHYREAQKAAQGNKYFGDSPSHKNILASVSQKTTTAASGRTLAKGEVNEEALLRGLAPSDMERAIAAELAKVDEEILGGRNESRWGDSRFSFFGTKAPSVGRVLSALASDVARFPMPPISTAHEIMPGIFPDFISAGVSFTVPTKWTGELGGVSFQLTMDRYGDLYGGGGISVGRTEKEFAANITVGWMNQLSVPNQGQLEHFLSGKSYGASVGYGIGVSEHWAPGYGSATSTGFFTPQAGIDVSYSKEFFHNNFTDEKYENTPRW